MHSKPFNLEHAKTGAPVGFLSGDKVRILCFDRIDPNKNTIVGLYFHNGREGIFQTNEKGDCGLGGNLIMLPIAMIENKPVFTGDELEIRTDNGWTKFKTPIHFKPALSYTYRWPQSEEETTSTAIHLIIEAGTSKAEARKTFEQAIALI